MRCVALCLIALLVSGTAGAQEPAPPPATSEGAGWVASLEANAFVGFNYQYRKFRDFSAWESQNWVMGTLARRVGRGTLTLDSMFSLEALTLRDLGSPQVFQTGETYRSAALIDYQHPHDVVMKLGGEYRALFGRFALLAAAGLVSSPSLGPTPFMHRPSAAHNPQVPLSHHHLDATHIAPGVVRGGIGAGAWTAEASWFRGREPDENRWDLDLGALDSMAARVSWASGHWSAQASGAYLTQPEFVTPYDAKRLTASVSRSLGPEERGVSWMAAFGQNREIHGNLEVYTFEANLRTSPNTAFYVRAESVAKDILDVGFHPRGTLHRHRQSQVAAFTFGSMRDLARARSGTFGLGADITAYTVPDNLSESYGSPVSFHVFMRYRVKSGDQPPSHVH